MLSTKELAVALLPVAHPIAVLPLGHLPLCLNSLAKVTIGKSPEVIGNKSMHQVLHTSVGTDITAAVVSLCLDNNLYERHHVYLQKIR